jgi:hypothetical protein
MVFAVAGAAARVSMAQNMSTSATFFTFIVFDFIDIP